VIIREGDTLVGESRRKYNHIRAEQLKSEDEGISLMPFTSHPVLKEWDDSITLPPSFENYLNEKQPDTLKNLNKTTPEQEVKARQDNESKGDN
jgi:general secretion pathway protein D